MIAETELKAWPALIRDEEHAELLSLNQTGALVARWQRAGDTGAPASASLWSFHAKDAQGALAALLAAGDTAGVHAHLADLHTQTTLRGYDQHQRITALLDGEPGHRSAMARRIQATLLRLYAALGIIRVPNPEQPGDFPWLEENRTATLLPAAAAALGLAGRFPVTTQGAWGLRTPLGLLSHRHAIGLGYLREVRAVLAAHPGRHDQMVEIGGGLGRTTLHLARDLGLCCRLIDLPVVSATQYALLTANRVPCQLWPDDAGAPPAPGSVHLHNAFALPGPDSFSRSLFLNADSFVEMDAPAQDAYLALIAASGSDLLSINQEAAQVMTPRGDVQTWQIAARAAGHGLRPGPRYLFWERPGYVVQLFLNPSR